MHQISPRKWLTPLLFFAICTAAQADIAGLTPAQNQIWQKVYNYYSPSIEKSGGQLSLQVVSSPAGYASASREGTTGEKYILRTTDSYLQTPRLSDQVWLVTLCHEMGHFLGQAPNKPAPIDWDGPTNEKGELLLVGEGAADFFAATSCVPALNANTTPPESTDTLLQAAYDFLTLFGGRVDRQGRASEVVPKTITTYPTRQCRWDTFSDGLRDSNSKPLPCWFKNP